MVKTRKCPKCKGLGRIAMYADIRGGQCYRCGGSGVEEYGRKAPSACLSIDEINARLTEFYPQHGEDRRDGEGR